MEDKAFSSIDLVGQCLIDKARCLAFEKGIKSVVKPNHTVLDVGTGSGILALFDARAGAKKVFALEYDPYVAKIALENFKNNNLDSKITLLRGDARSFKYPKDLHVDVVTMEMLTTGMVDEFQVQAINNLHKQKIVDKKTIFIPKLQETYISLAEKAFTLYGFNIRMVKHLWNNLSQDQKLKLLSDKILISSVDFSKINNEKFTGIFTIKVTNSGILNSVYLSSLCYITDSVVMKDTETLNSPVIIPFKKDLRVKKGDLLKVKINYVYGHGYNNFFVDLI
ncbi:MAG: 50S ribosomal protein L11 methyltransferase [Candidatus Paceibacterota bacterium]